MASLVFRKAVAADFREERIVHDLHEPDHTGHEERSAEIGERPGKQRKSDKVRHRIFRNEKRPPREAARIFVAV